MKSNRIAFAFLTLFVSTNVFAAAQTFFVSTPAELGDCNQQAQVVLAQINQNVADQASRLSIDESKVVYDDAQYKQCNITVEYNAPRELFPYVAVTAESDMPNVHPLVGIYGSYQECLGQISKQVALFESATKTKAAAVSCVIGSIRIVEPTYAIEIFTFGTPALKLFGYKNSILAPMDQITQKQVAAVLTGQKAQVAHISEGVALYYASNYVPVKNENMQSFVQISDCKSQVEIARAIYLKADADPLFLQCRLADEQTPDAGANLQVVAGSYAVVTSNNGEGSRSYETFEDCMRARPIYVEKSMAKDAYVLGGLCQKSFRDHSYFVTLYKRY